MDREWILVACPTSARLFERVSATESIRPVRTILEEELGTSSPAGAPPARLRPAPSPQRRRHLRFAGLLAEHLEQALVDERCDRITLVAGCPFLGALRMSLSPALRRAVTTSVNLDMVDESPAAIGRELARHRFASTLRQSASAVRRVQAPRQP